MAILTAEQLEQIRTIIRDASTAVAVHTSGTEVSDAELQRLAAEGYVKPEAIQDLVLNSFEYGQLMARLDSAKDMSFEEFRDHIEKNPIARSRQEENALAHARARAGEFCVGLGSRMSGDLAGEHVKLSEQFEQEFREGIQTETAQAVERRASVGSLKSKLGQMSKDWARDWGRIAATEMHLAHQQGFFEQIAGDYGDGELMAKIPEPTACPDCSRLYLDADGRPKVRPASWWAGQGVSNVGLKRAEWRAVIGAAHSWCQCQLIRVPKGFAFDESWDLVPEEMATKSAMPHDAAPTLLKAGPYIGPRGGKWADAAHTIPWKEGVDWGMYRDVASGTSPEQWHKWVGKHGLTPEQSEKLRQKFIAEEKAANRSHARSQAAKEAALAFKGAGMASDVALVKVARAQPSVPVGEGLEKIGQLFGGLEQKYPAVAKLVSAGLVRGIVKHTARGKSGHSANYNPKTKNIEINQAEFTNAGVLLHEVGHALEEAAGAGWMHQAGWGAEQPSASEYAASGNPSEQFAEAFVQLVAGDAKGFYEHASKQARVVAQALRNAKSEALEKSAHKLHYRTEFAGLPISIENRKGSVRRWYDPHTKTHGETRMEFPYGYIRLTEGMDGDHVDCYLGPDEKAENVYIVHQRKAPHFKTWDEDKTMLGFPTAAAAKRAYLRHFDRPEFFGDMTTMPTARFVEKVKNRELNGQMIKHRGQLELFDWVKSEFGGVAGYVSGQDRMVGTMGHHSPPAKGVGARMADVTEDHPASQEARKKRRKRRGKVRLVVKDKADLEAVSSGPLDGQARGKPDLEEQHQVERDTEQHRKWLDNEQNRRAATADRGRFQLDPRYLR